MTADWIHKNIVLVGQPNCGKSTIFNEAAGYKSISSNFPGATVTFTKSHVKIDGCTCDVTDLPGIYSLDSSDDISKETLQYLLSSKVDVIVNVMDASLVSRSLELTLQLIELDKPMILCLNMIDEAGRKGIQIDKEGLSRRLCMSVVETIASRGRGVKFLFTEALKIAEEGSIPCHIQGHRDVEKIVNKLIVFLKDTNMRNKEFTDHLFATRLLERDYYFEKILNRQNPELMNTVEKFRKNLELTHGRSSDEVISDERHSLSMSIFEEIADVKRAKIDWRDRLDEVLMHNVWGYLSLVVILFLFFNFIFKLGSLIEVPMVSFFDGFAVSLYNILHPGSLISVIVKGAVQGIGGGIAIIAAYLFPFLFGLAILEDVGYLPRVAFLLDGFMHKIGLHGKSVIPAVLGYGCNVPAVMSARIMESPRDRFITVMIATMVPCAARMTVIMGLAGQYLGGIFVFIIYILNLIIIGLTGAVMNRMLPEITPGLMFEIPGYQIPRIKILLMKTWLRLKDFIIIAWPLLVAGSVILGLIDFYGITEIINTILSPLTVILGLPAEVGVTLIFGVLRKELSMLMLRQALGTDVLSSVMSSGQMFVFTIFVVFYIPCVATIGAIYKQIRAKRTLFIIIFTIVIAIVLGVLTRGVSLIIWQH